MIFTAHSIPESMARVSTYRDTVARGVSTGCASGGRVEVGVGLSEQEWLARAAVAGTGYAASGCARQESRSVVVAPIGFISDHMEVLYDLDIEARELAETLGITDGARGDRRRASRLRAHGSGTCRRAHARPRWRWRLSPRLLSAS